MAERATEARHRMAAGLEGLDDSALLALLAEGQMQAVRAVAGALPELAQAAEIVARTLRSGGRVIWCGAGSSGLIALTDAVEMPGTYGIAEDRIGLCIAGGTADLARLDSSAEDDEAAGAQAAAALGIGPADCMIAVSASGATRYTLAAMRQAAGQGAATVALACNPGAPMLEEAACGVLLATPPEVIAGSTRMGAGTAQKAALNMISTLAAIRLGRSLDGQMTSLRVDNTKLRQRATGIVAEVGRCDLAAAARWLALAGDNIPAAILLARGAESNARAGALLAETGGDLGAALAKLMPGRGSE